MAISVGDKLPNTQFLVMQDGIASPLEFEEISKGRKIILFGLPGAYTGTCSTKHVPSFIAAADDIRAKGVEGIYCLSVNDPYVTDKWEKEMGADRAGITMIADPAAEFTKAIGMAFTAPMVGFYDRCTRFAAIVEDGVVTTVSVEETRGVCDLTSGSAILEKL